MQSSHLPPPQQPPSSSSFLPFSASSLKEPKTTLSVVLATSHFSLLFFLALSSSSSSPPSSSSRPDPYLFRSRLSSIPASFSSSSSSIPSPPPSIAYLISGSNGDSSRILRLLFAVYHPHNHYLLHLDRFASKAERDRLALNVQSIPIFKAAQNVDVVGKADFV